MASPSSPSHTSLPTPETLVEDAGLTASHEAQLEDQPPIQACHNDSSSSSKEDAPTASQHTDQSASGSPVGESAAISSSDPTPPSAHQPLPSLEASNPVVAEEEQPDCEFHEPLSEFEDPFRKEEEPLTAELVRTMTERAEALKASGNVMYGAAQYQRAAELYNDAVDAGKPASSHVGTCMVQVQDASSSRQLS